MASYFIFTWIWRRFKNKSRLLWHVNLLLILKNCQKLFETYLWGISFITYLFIWYLRFLVNLLGKNVYRFFRYCIGNQLVTILLISYSFTINAHKPIRHVYRNNAISNKNPCTYAFHMHSASTIPQTRIFSIFPPPLAHVIYALQVIAWWRTATAEGELVPGRGARGARRPRKSRARARPPRQWRRAPPPTARRRTCGADTASRRCDGGPPSWTPPSRLISRSTTTHTITLLCTNRLFFFCFLYFMFFCVTRRKENFWIIRKYLFGWNNTFISFNASNYLNWKKNLFILNIYRSLLIQLIHYFRINFIIYN